MCCFTGVWDAQGYNGKVISHLSGENLSKMSCQFKCMPKW